MNASKLPRIILLAFQFPPYSDVGGARWGALAPRMADLGYDVHVLTTDWGAESDFYRKHFPNLWVHILPSGSPHKLRFSKLRNPFLTALKNIPFRVFIDPLFFPVDYATRWGSAVEAKISDLAGDVAETVLIATGAPFSVNHLAARMKQKHPQLKLIQDFRDTWTGNPYAKQNSKLVEMESFAVQAADGVVAVSKTLLDEYRQRGQPGHTAVITSGFDEALLQEEGASFLGNKPAVLLHLGSLTNGREEPLYELLAAVSQNKELWGQVQIQQVGTTPSRVLMHIKKTWPKLIEEKVFVCTSKLPQKLALQKFRLADFGLLLNSRKLEYALSTKIYEYMALRVPTFSLHYGGEIEKFLQRHPVAVDVHLGKEPILPKLKMALSGQAQFQFDSAIQYSYGRIAASYADFIQKVVGK